MLQFALVVPCYNEEAVLPHSHRLLREELDKLIAAGEIKTNSRIYYVDDGSRDNTWNIIQKLAKQDEHVVGLKLSRNCGHQNAVLAGLMQAEGDAVVSLDADLQDDLAAISKMLKAYASGHDVVYGVRDSRTVDSWFKRISASGFYRFMNLMGVDVVQHHADFRLLSRRAIEHLRDFREVNLFLRGLVPLLGFRSCEVHYDRQPRQAGETKYPFKRMLALALDGITSQSMVPLRLIGIMGFFIFALTSAMSAWVLFLTLFTDDTVPGWASTVLPSYFLGGIQILCLGVIGEYLGKIYSEVKDRPRFHIEQTTE